MARRRWVGEQPANPDPTRDVGQISRPASGPRIRMGEVRGEKRGWRDQSAWFWFMGLGVRRRGGATWNGEDRHAWCCYALSVRLPICDMGARTGEEMGRPETEEIRLGFRVYISILLDWALLDLIWATL